MAVAAHVTATLAAGLAPCANSPVNFAGSFVSCRDVLVQLDDSPARPGLCLIPYGSARLGRGLAPVGDVVAWSEHTPASCDDIPDASEARLAASCNRSPHTTTCLKTMAPVHWVQRVLHPCLNTAFVVHQRVRPMTPFSLSRVNYT